MIVGLLQLLAQIVPIKDFGNSATEFKITFPFRIL